MSRTFTARYDGRCIDCGEIIMQGDLLTYDAEDQVVHASCGDTSVPTKPAEVCTVCCMTKAANGACGCDQ